MRESALSLASEVREILFLSSEAMRTSTIIRLVGDHVLLEFLFGHRAWGRHRFRQVLGLAVPDHVVTYGNVRCAGVSKCLLALFAVLVVTASPFKSR